MNRAPARPSPGRAGPGRAGLAAKRALDLAVASLLLAVAAVPMLLLALMVRWQFRRPVLFRQVRVTGPGALSEDPQAPDAPCSR